MSMPRVERRDKVDKAGGSLALVWIRSRRRACAGRELLAGGALPVGQQPQEVRPIVPLDDDARHVRDHRIEHHDDPQPGGIPQEEQHRRRESDVVCQLSAARFPHPASQVLPVVRDDPPHGEPAAEHRPPRWQPRFPHLDSEQPLVDASAALPCPCAIQPLFRIQDGIREPNHQISNGRLEYCPSDAIQYDRPSDRQIKHAQRSSPTSACADRAAFPLHAADNVRQD